VVKILFKAVEGKSPHLPQYQSPGSAGADIRACLNEPVVIKPGDSALIPTGFQISLTVGWEAQIRPRSGLALHSGVTLLNSPGTIDSDYRGEVKILMINLGKEDFVVNDGDRIAQMVFARVYKAEFEVADKLPESLRGEGGFGHSGI
jgi:dUTP pyrophosphatase